MTTDARLTREGAPLCHAGRLPMTLVTGFLGSGKTTLLREVVGQQARGEGKRLVLLVNEFATLDVDGLALRRALGPVADVVPIPGGSIFCTCLVSRFIAALNEVVDRHAASPIDGLLVEASGAANPAVARQLLKETGLDQSVDLRRIVCVADPVSLPKLIHTLPNVQTQLAASDTVVLNQIDRVTPDALERCERLIREHNAVAPIHRCLHGKPCPELMEAPAEPRDMTGELGACRDPNFAKDVFRPGAAVPFEALRETLNHWADRAYRIKGRVDTDRGPTEVSLTTGGLELRLVDDRQPVAGVRAENHAEAGLAVIVAPELLQELHMDLEAISWAIRPPELDPGPGDQTSQARPSVHEDRDEALPL